MDTKCLHIKQGGERLSREEEAGLRQAAEIIRGGVSHGNRIRPGRRRPESGILQENIRGKGQALGQSPDHPYLPF